MKVVAQTRNEQGSGASRRLRRSGKVPGIIYGGNGEPTRIAIDHNPLYHSMRVEAFHSSILDIELDGRTERALLRDVQWHAYKPQVMHVDFMRVSADQEITVSIPFHFKNQETSPAVKLQGALVNHVMNEIEISCLPDRLPEFIEVDLSQISTETAVHLSDIVFPEGVTPVLHGTVDPVVANAAVVAEESDEAAADEALGAVGVPAAGAAPASAAGGDSKKS